LRDRDIDVPKDRLDRESVGDGAVVKNTACTAM
jgi:hypothetical protein